jgi:hypothetical protein
MKPIEAMSDSEFAETVRRAEALLEPPPHLTRRAIDLWPAAPLAPLRAAAGAWLRHVSALLTFDSWAVAPAASGLRSAADRTHHLLFNAQGRDIDLRVSPNDDRFAIAGQILGPDEAGGIELVAYPRDAAAAAPLRSAQLDPMGEFRLDGIDPGRYLLSLRLGNDLIVLPPIDVGERTP